MGSGTYDSGARFARAASDGYHTKSRQETFRQSDVHESLSPRKLVKRECFDSPAHPASLPVIIGLDVTGSMGHIPHNLIKDGLPTMMTTLIGSGLPDAAVCFLAIGDHLRDSGPLQVGQFESGDLELDKCLLNTWIEEGGGGNDGESYSLAWLFAAKHTHTHAWEKRKQKGFLFTIGDEPFHPTLDKGNLQRIFDTPFEANLSSVELLEKARERYEVFHILIGDEYDHSRWNEALGKNVLKIRRGETDQIPLLISKTIVDHYHVFETGTPTSTEAAPTQKQETKITL